MVRSLVFAALAAVVLLPSGAAAQSARDEDALNVALTEMKEAWNRDDLQGHVALYAEDATFMQGTGPARGRAAILEGLARSFRRDGDLVGTLAFTEVEVRMLGADAALMLGRFTLTGLPDGRTSEGRFSLVWRRTPAGWRIVHDHSS